MHTKRCSTYVISGCEGAIRPADFSSSILKTLEGLRRGDLMDQVTIWI